MFILVAYKPFAILAGFKNEGLIYGTKKARLPLRNQNGNMICFPQELYLTLEQAEYLWKLYSAKKNNPDNGGGTQGEEGE